MDRKTTVIAGVAGVAFVMLAWSGYWVHAADREDLEELRARLDGLTAEAAIASPSGGEDDASSKGIREIERALEELSMRMTRIESTSRRVAVGISPPTPEEELASAGDETASVGPDEAARQEFEELLAELVKSGWDYTNLGDNYQRFLEMARSTGILDERIEVLEALVEAAPNEVEGRMDLADAYVAKLMTAAGPEQGLWGNRATDQWLAVVDLDDAHWGAHSSLGTNYSYYPVVMGKTNDAIHHLERARQLQRVSSPTPEHVQTYVFLARLYDNSGRTDEARDVLLEGLQAHPNDTQLEAALAQLE